MDSSFNKSICGKNINDTYRGIEVLLLSFLPSSIYFFLIFLMLNINNTVNVLSICIYLSVFLYISNVLHEIGHYIVGKLLKFKVEKINYSLMFTSVQIKFSKNNSSKLSKIVINLAGVLTNLVIMLICILLLSFSVVQSVFWIYVINITIYMNLVLIIINSTFAH